MDDTNPLIGSPPSEVPLEKAPLIRVLAQVRFSPILSIQKSDFIAPFQEAIRERYPIVQTERIHLVLGLQGLENSEPQVVWRFIDISGNWRVSLAPDSISLETVAYSSRSDFLSRLKQVLVALGEHIKPSIFERFGLRYIDRLIISETLNTRDILKFVRPEASGVLAANFNAFVSQTISDSVFNLPNDEGAQVRARWGILPPNSTIDITTVEPILEPSWVLDLDMFVSTQQEFNVDVIASNAQRFSERIYSVFRWIVTDEFLRYFGGEI